MLPFLDEIVNDISENCLEIKQLIKFDPTLLSVSDQSQRVVNQQVTSNLKPHVCETKYILIAHI